MSDDIAEPTDLEKAKIVIKEIYNGATRKEAFALANITPYKFGKVLDSSPDLNISYARAQIGRAEDDADSIVEIADNELIDPNRARNMIDARKWRAAKMNPHKYGDRLDLTVNQTVDIKTALDRANSRLELPISYPRQSQDEQVIEMKDVTPQVTTGSEPVETKDPHQNESIDIFS
jgi:hypothetical protein